MKQLEHVRSGDKISATTLNEIIDAINRLQNMGVGPGLTIRQTNGAPLVCLESRPKAASGAVKTLQGTPKALDCTQGVQDTDTWDSSTDYVPCEVQVVTDVEYNATTGVLSMRYRTITIKMPGAVSAEGTLVEVTTAEDCPEE